jgi:uncharacterized protein YbcV (DUF1398 family)
VNDDQLNVIHECAASSMAGTISFAEVVARLSRVGVERYHADYSRAETTYYLSDGDSCVVPMQHAAMTIANAFSAQVVEASVRQSQRAEIAYPQFLAQTSAAGCVGYFVQITGQRVHYFGRDGGIHTEWFPGAKRD